MADFPESITESIDQLLLEHRRQEEARIRQVICDSISGWNVLHGEMQGSACADFFSDAGCNIDAWAVGKVAHYG